MTKDAKKQKRRLTADDVQKRLPEFMLIKKETYVNTKHRSTFVDREYGEFEAYVGNILQGGKHPERAKKDMIAKRTLSEEQITEKMSKFDGISIDIESYKNVNVKARFIDDEYGEFWATPSNVFKGQRHPDGRWRRCKETMIERYGVEHNSHIPEVAKKMAKSSRNSYTRIHWKTGGEVVCQGKLELAVVDYLNKHRIDYDWQIIFSMPDGRKYRVDMYLPDEDKYIEIKGYFRRPANREKWEWFHKTHPNSELWTEPTLRTRGIITQKKNKFWEVG